MTLTVGSLFSGIGGIDLALERAGMQVAWQVENHRAANQVLARHWPNVPRYGDVRGVIGQELSAVDVLAAGFPCQDLSIAGHGAGLAGERSGLFFEIVRLAGEIAPTWLLLENVPNLLGVNGGGDFGTVVDSLVGLGYCVAWRVLDAQHFGVPQRRRRIFLVGHLGERAAPFQVLFEPNGCRRDPTPSREVGQSIAGTLGGGTPGRGWSDDTDRMTFVYACQGSKVGEFGTLRSGNGNVTGGVPFVAGGQTARYGKDTISDADALIPFDTTQITSAQNYSQPRAGDTDHPLGATTHAPAIAFSGDSRLAVAEELSGCLLSSQTPAVLRVSSVRRLTPLECERLMGIPDGFTAGLSDAARYRLLGNSVAVPCVEWIARRLVAVAEQLAEAAA